ncbi:DUF3592 domain-containing protein [Streptomyces sp. NPDC059694]|uniref:DUF3592 domain-containing protein n=3 Tax=Streptomyces TaxID=1883 RepID=UPI0026D34520
MSGAMSGTSVAVAAIGFVCVPLTALVLLSLPTQLRDNRLKRRGVETEAVCRELIRRNGILVHFIRCSYQQTDGRPMVTRINSPRPVPQVGESFTVVFDPQRPEEAASAQYLASRQTQLGYAFQAALAVLVTVAVLLVTVFD